MKKVKFIRKGRLPAGTRAVSRPFVIAILAVLVLVFIFSVQAPGSQPAKEAEESYGPIGMFFKFLGSNPFFFLLMVLAIGYPLGRIEAGGHYAGADGGTTADGRGACDHRQ